MNWLQSFIELLQIAPGIIGAILSIEAIFGKGQGAAKKAVLMSFVSPSVPAPIVADLSKAVDATVLAMKPMLDAIHEQPVPPK